MAKKKGRVEEIETSTDKYNTIVRKSIKQIKKQNHHLSKFQEERRSDFDGGNRVARRHLARGWDCNYPNAWLEGNKTTRSKTKRGVFLSIWLGECRVEKSNEKGEWFLIQLNKTITNLKE